MLAIVATPTDSAHALALQTMFCLYMRTSGQVQIVTIVGLLLCRWMQMQAVHRYVFCRALVYEAEPAYQ